MEGLNFEVGTAVVESAGFYRGCTFKYLGNGKGLHERWGERELIAPVPKIPLAEKKKTKTPKPPKIKSINQRLRAGEIVPLSELPTYGDALDWFLKNTPFSVRMHTGPSHENVMRKIFSSYNIAHPLDWRPVNQGATNPESKGMRGPAAVIYVSKDKLPDDVKLWLEKQDLKPKLWGSHYEINDLGFVIRVLSEGRDLGWQVTRSC